jgi:hypothetical protein
MRPVLKRRTMSSNLKYGFLFYDIPQKVKGGYKVPEEMRRIGTHCQLSVWLFPMARYSEVVDVQSRLLSGNGIKSRVIRAANEDERQLLEVAREALNNTIGRIVSGLQASIEALEKQLDDGEKEVKDMDQQIKIRFRNAKKQLSDALECATGFALTGDFTEAIDSAAKAADAMFEKAQINTALKLAQKILQ